MITLSKIYIRVRKLPPGSFAFYGETEQANFVEADELRKLLFAWHAESFYGTQLESHQSEYGEGLVLTPYMAMAYLAAPTTLLHAKLSWDENALQMQRYAQIMKEALAAGWYKPSYEHWRNEGIVAWELNLPQVKMDELSWTVGTVNDNLRKDWFNAVVNELLSAERAPEIHQAWHQLTEDLTLLQVDMAESSAARASYNWMQEDDWLQAIGWQRDNTPYRICLQLVEPYAETYVDGTTTAKDDGADWRLRLLAQDYQDANRIVEFNSAGTSLNGQIPVSWQEGIEGKLQEQMGRILRISPSLESKHQPGKLTDQLFDEQAWEFLNEASIQLVASGISVFLPAWWAELQRARPQLKAKVKSSVGASRTAMFGMDQLMQFDWRIALGGVDLSEAEFTELTQQKKRLIYIRGKWVQLDPAHLDQIRAAMRQVEKKKGLTFRDVLEMHLLDTDVEGTDDAEVTALDHGQKALKISVELNNSLRTLMKQLNQTKSIPLVEEVSGLEAELRPYQVEGVSWLLFLRSMGLGGCLADDMGLGKTIQFISYLLLVKEQRFASLVTEQAMPALLICPTSVLGNWQKELARFAPTLRVHLHYGSQRAKDETFSTSIEGADVVMTSYNLAQLDEQELSSVTWNTLCLDEAQNIKNAYTKQSQAIRTFAANQRIALTGTPIENRLTELWSIFDFANPGYLGTLSYFSHQYVGPIEKGGDGAAKLTLRVQRLIRPFLLRRVKNDPAIQLDLPDKVESKVYVSLTPEQGALYENVVQNLLERIESLSGMEKKGLILASLMKLKQICDHPGLFLKEAGMRAGGGAVRSAKLARLLEMIDELRSEGGSCLIFTQFVEMGHLLQGALEQGLGEPVQFLHGGLSKTKRDEMIARFQDVTLPAQERSHIFILSLKAGGTGLNLTAANHVFHFDRWWNPAVENQATDRAFRIGQTRDVQVHKFVTLGTLEERIDEMIERKQGLSDQIVGTGENWVTEMSTSELRELFALRREWMEK